MTRVRLVAAVFIVTMVGLGVYVRLAPNHGHAVDLRLARNASCSTVGRAFAEHRTQLWLTLAGTVVRTLPDTHGHFTHQRFVVACPAGQTVLIVNDVDLGQRAPVRPGLHIAVRGEYVWNDRGGLVHFTHHDSVGSGEDGWIVVEGRAYALQLPHLRPNWLAAHDPVFSRLLQGGFA